ncbi:hypothetical protein PRUPE_1G007500 [Prunus persica]|uniref:PGG domain-containing protein n=2 Tax=Prunus persica TaxID=3760 RepID=A0A251QRT5_PRUPE|nr:hypothetical protein PRUPE_1G007500 [Prunus persica]
MGTEVESQNATVSQEKMSNSLFENAMNGEWEKVVEVYGSSQSAKVQEMRITRAGDTALHIAASDGETKIVRQLLQLIGNNASKILQIKNKKGNTPLHLAAVVGDVETCHAMATKDPELVSSLNNENETPLFLAALNGHEKVFLCLHSHCVEECYSFRARNGDTILHAAMSGEYFSLAFQIILWYPELVNYINQSGFSPLHILANTPSAFKSSSRLRPLDRLIYQCLIVEELKGGKEDKKSICPLEKRGRSIIDTGSESHQALTKSWGNRMCSSLCLSKRGNKKEDVENSQQESSSMSAMNQREEDGRESRPNYIYSSCVEFFNLITAVLVAINAIWRIDKIQDEKRRHIWATQVMNQLVEHSNLYKNVQSSGEAPDEKDKFGDVPDPTEFGDVPDPTEKKGNKEDEKKDNIVDKKDKDNNLGDKKTDKDNLEVKKQTPILIAAKMGVSEMVEKILEKFPVAIEDVDSENKNVALLAVENRQPHVYRFLVHSKKITSLLRQVDNNGNNALHLAAKCGGHRPWLTPGAALQMQWELKWYKFVKESLPPRASVRYNKAGQIPQEIFTTSHKDLRKEGSNWLVKTSESCSVVAALIATVAFATSASVPGGLDDKTGSPVFKDKPAFNAFTISSLLALCLSVTALVFFLSIITSRYEAHDFSISLPRKLLLGLTSLFASITAVLVSFCTGHIFLLDRQLRYVAYPLYAATCLPVTIFALAQLSLYYDLIRVIFRKVPQRSYKEYRH